MSELQNKKNELIEQGKTNDAKAVKQIKKHIERKRNIAKARAGMTSFTVNVNGTDLRVTRVQTEESALKKVANSKVFKDLVKKAGGKDKVKITVTKNS